MPRRSLGLASHKYKILTLLNISIFDVLDMLIARVKFGGEKV